MKRAVSFADPAIPFVSIISAGSGIAVAATAYGCLAIRLFVGSAAAQRMLAGPWPWHYWIDIPMVPFMLVASQLPVMANFSTWLPTLVALPVTSYPTPIRNTMMLYRYAGITAEPRRYPPSPIMTVRRSCLPQALCIPWIRVAYFTLKRMVFQAVLRPNRSTNNGLSRNDALRAGYNGSEIGVQDTYETLDDGSMVLDDSAGQGVLIEDLHDYFLNENALIPGTIYLSYEGVARFLLGGLTLPFAANAMGSLLGFIARFSPYLARFLGVKGTTVWQSPSLVDPSPGIDVGISPGLTISSNWNVDLPSVYDDLDPVWYRNAIGGGLFIVLKDAFTLAYRYLHLRSRRSIRVKDLPFSDSVAAELVQSGIAPPASESATAHST